MSKHCRSPLFAARERLIADLIACKPPLFVPGPASNAADFRSAADHLQRVAEAVDRYQTAVREEAAGHARHEATDIADRDLDTLFADQTHDELTGAMIAEARALEDEEPYADPHAEHRFGARDYGVGAYGPFGR